MGFRFILGDHPPFTTVDRAIAEQLDSILGEAARNGEDIAEILSEASDTQVANVASYEGMPEDEGWYFGFEFCQEWAPTFKQGFRAFVYTHEECHYIFVHEREELIVRKVRRIIERLPSEALGEGK